MKVHTDEVLIVNSHQRNGLILCKSYHAEFAGPGAAVGGFADVDCQDTIPVGNFSLVSPESHEEQHRALLIRRQWIRLFKQITDNPLPLQRAKMLLTHFEHYFGSETVEKLPDEPLARLVGVLPQTMRTARLDLDGGGAVLRI